MNIRNHGMKVIHGAIAALLTLMMPSAYGDDLEVFTNPGLSAVTPNLIFVLDLSGSMNSTPAGNTPVGTEDSRLDILKDAISGIMSSGLPEINVGYTYFRNNSATGIRFPAAELTSDASTIDPAIPAGTLVQDVINGMVAGASASQETPTVSSLYEVAKYLRGEKPHFGLKNFGSWNVGSNKYTGGDYRAANPASYTGSVSTVYTTLSDPTGSNKNCKDYSASISPFTGSNACADEEAAGVELNCYPVNVPAYGGRQCTTTVCDSGCGTTCPGGTVYTQPATGCLLDNSNNIWVTKTTGGQPSRCCQTADSGNTECLSNLNYPSSCPSGTQCKFSNNAPPLPAYTYRRCDYKTKTTDTRVYTSPITAQCQKTAVVLLTDGDPSANTVDWGRLYSNGNARGPRRIRQMIADYDSDPTNNRNDILCDDYSDEFGGATPFSIRHANCGKELVEFMHDEDQIPTLEGSTVDTYTIGFGLVGPAAAATWGYLNDLADAGGGDAFQATDLSSLTDAFDQIIANVTSGNQRFSGFATSFDTGTLQTGNKAYLTLFNPADERAWDGNVKGYFVNDGIIRDVNGDVATEIDAFTGKLVFKPGARSFWSSSADGNSTLQGGARDTLTPASRNIYVTTDSSDTSNVSLADGNHNLDTSNTNLTAGLMGMPGSATASDVIDMIDWARSARMGDPLHTEPRTIQYGSSTGEVLYFTTNQGYLHAINVTNPTVTGDTTGGDEMFAFMPYKMVGTLQDQYAGNVAGSHLYGLDGPMTVWTNDSNGDGAITGGEKAYLFFGMRRGGNSYYAMDVSDPNNPKLMWQIDGGTTGFDLLGESWSSMTIAAVNDGGSARHVLVFGGGYDSASQDVANTARDSSGDDVGMGIYIVDALTGALLNSVGKDDTGTGTAEFKVDVPAMQYSIPSAVRTEDTDGNGFTDRLYVGDTGGQVWRIDIAEGASITSAGTLSAYLFADLGVDSGGSTSAATNRRFYYPPSVAHLERNGDTVTSLALGSGYRAHPLNSTVEEGFTVLFDENEAIGTPASTPSPLTITNLYDATANLIQTTTGSAQTTEINSLNAKKGWYINLSTEQKVLARARTFKNIVFFTAFESGTTDVCDFAGGTNRFYAVSLTDATGAIEEDTDNDGYPDDYVRDIGIDDQAAILGPPELVTHTEEGDPTSPDPFCTSVFAGAQAVMQFCDAPVRVNWQTTQ